MNAKPLKPKQVVIYADEIAQKISNGLGDEGHYKFYRKMVKKYPVSSINKAYDLTKRFQEMTDNKIVPHKIFKLALEKHPPKENESEKYENYELN